MDETIRLSSDALTTSGILLLSIVAVQIGGLFMVRLVRGRHPATEFQLRFARAGHAHAGVLVILGLIVQILADAAAMEGALSWVARSGVPLAAILMPAGFFFSSAGRDVTEPNRFIALVYVGAIVLAVSVVTLGFSLLTA